MLRRLWPSLALFPPLLVLIAAVRSGHVPGDNLVAQYVHCDDFPLYGALGDAVGAAPWAVLVVAAAAALWWRGQRVSAGLLLFADVSTELIGIVTKRLVDRQQTVGDEPQSGFESVIAPGVFPSAHVLRAMVTLGVLVAITVWPRPTWRKPAIVAVALFLLLLGLARIEVRAHWLSDVVGAYLLGGIWLDVLLSVAWWLLPGWRARPLAREEASHAS